MQPGPSSSLDLPVTTLVEQLELDLINNGHGDEDVSALHRWNGAKGAN